ncbi:Hypothetical predicted protein [Pelobates cultripes]|uniref:Secreted protein n=1 Tax=Pelobates cultripes TaxID=61616 RepID=A0AAD1S9D8_PELCU|nr:Hypothetical predicted protein [Pelobates cultripes]
MNKSIFSCSVGLWWMNLCVSLVHSVIEKRGALKSPQALKSVTLVASNAVTPTGACSQKLSVIGDPQGFITHSYFSYCVKILRFHCTIHSAVIVLQLCLNN